MLQQILLYLCEIQWKLYLKRFNLLELDAFVYVLFFREYLVQTGTLFELSAKIVGTHFCNIGPFKLCFTSNNFPELIFLQRIFVNLFLPLKWFLDFIWLFEKDSIYNLPVFIIRLSAFIHIWIFISAVIYLIRHSKFLSSFHIFIMIYFVLYSSIFFYQSSRQVMFITLIAFIFSKLNIRHKI